MANPFAQFAPQQAETDAGAARFAAPQVADSVNPFAQYAPEKPATPVDVARKDFGVDLLLPADSIRAQIAKLPEAQRKKALDLWAEHFVANEYRGGNGVGGMIDNTVRALARGTPIGSWLDEANAKTMQFAHNISGGALGAPEDETLAYNRARDRKFDADNPKTSFGLKLGGAVASLPVSPGVRVVEGTSMLGRMGNAAATGAVYGGLYGAGEGEDAKGRTEGAIKGTLLGGGIGAAAVPVAQGLGNAIQYTADKFRSVPAPLGGLNSRAVDRVSRAMADDQLYRPNAALPAQQRYATEAARLGPEGMLADMGPNLMSQTQAITTQRGPGQQILKDAIEQRARGAAGRIDADVTGALGPARNLVQVEDAMMTAARDRARPLYEQFYATPIPMTQELNSALQRVPQAVYGRAQNLAEMEGIRFADVRNTGRGIDLIKRAVDDIAREAPRGSNLERITSGLARDIRNATDAAISPHNPAASPWAQARSLSGEGLQFREALDEGRNILSRNVHPDQLAADLAGMNPVQRAATLEGARGQIRDVMGNAASAGSSPADGLAAATAARKALGSDYARQKLDLVTQRAPGAPPPAVSAEQLANRLDAETAFANTRNTAWMGTQTAARTAAQKEFPNAASRREAASEIGKKGPAGLATEYVWRAANALLGGALDARNAAMMRDTALMLSAQGATRDQIARALMQYGRDRAISNQGRDAIARFAQEIMQAPRAPVIESATATSGPNRP